jgi:hypothetical protein
MKNDLEKKKESLLQKLFGLKDRIQKEKREREAVVEIETLQAAIEATDNEIFAAQVEAAKAKVKEIEAEALELAREKKDLQDRIEEIDVRLIELFHLCSELIPRKRVQISSTKTVKMSKEIFENFFIGFFESSTPILEGGVETGRKIKVRRNIEQRKRTIYADIQPLPPNLEHARDLGYTLAPGEKIESEELTPENSIEAPCFAMPAVFSGGI